MKFKFSIKTVVNLTLFDLKIDWVRLLLSCSQFESIFTLLLAL